MQAVARKKGACYMLLDINGQPAGEFDPVHVDSSQTSLDFGNTEITVDISHGGGMWNPVIERYIPQMVHGTGGSKIPIEPGNGVHFLLLIQGPLGEKDRQAATIEYITLEGDDHGPTTLTMHAMDILAMLQFAPCPSVPATWKEPYARWDHDAGGPYRVEHELSPIQMATMATNHTMRGPAIPVIGRIIQESLEARDRVRGWIDDPSEVVEREELPNSEYLGPEVLVRRTDDSVWDTIAPVCRNAGVTVRARLWLPGDKSIWKIPTDNLGYTFFGYRDYALLATNTVDVDRPIVVYTVHAMDSDPGKGLW